MRNDIHDCVDHLKQHGNLKETAMEHSATFIKYSRGLMALHSLMQPSRNWRTQCSVLYGPTGAGKTTFIRDYYPRAYWLMKQSTSGTIWWDGYSGEQVTILDEFYGEIPLAYMLRLLDQSPMRVQTKGGTTEFLSRRVIILSNTHPTQWYSASNVDAFYRRIDELIKCDVFQQFTEEELVIKS